MGSERVPPGRGLQRAAAILAALGPSGAADLEAVLDEQQRRALEHARASLGELAPEERRSLLASFADACRRKGNAAPQAPRRPPSRGPGEDTDKIPCPGTPPVPFLFMDGLELSRLGEALRRERPGIIALVLGNASEAAAAGVMGELPVALRRDVALALSQLRRPAPGVTSCVSEGLEEEVQLHARQENARLRTARRMAAALAAGDASTAAQVLDRIARDDAALCEAVVRELEALVPQAPAGREAGPPAEIPCRHLMPGATRGDQDRPTYHAVPQGRNYTWTGHASPRRMT